MDEHATYEAAVDLVRRTGKDHPCFLQRHLGISWGRAIAIRLRLIAEGVIPGTKLPGEATDGPQA